MAYYTDDSSLLGDIIYDGWQYASDGSVPGVTSNCDMNVIFNSMISGNRKDNPLISKNEEEAPPESGSELTSSTNSGVTSSTNSEVISSTSSYVTSSTSSDVTSDNSSFTSSENSSTTQ